MSFIYILVSENNVFSVLFKSCFLFVGSAYNKDIIAKGNPPDLRKTFTNLLFFNYEIHTHQQKMFFFFCFFFFCIFTRSGHVG